MRINAPAHLSDDELIAEVKRLAGCERESTVALISHLAEFDKRRLFLGAGCSSLFTYCTEVLRLSEHAAYHRIVAARMARRHPVVLRMLAQGSLNLTSVRLLAPYLAARNQEELFAAASGKSKRELQELLAQRFPQPDIVSSIRKLPAPRPPSVPRTPLAPPSAAIACASPTAAFAESSAPPSLDAPATVPPTAISPLSSKSCPAVTPLAPDRYQITFTASAETREKLQVAQDLMRHSIPSGNTAAIFDEALTALLEKLARKKFAATERPRASRGTSKGSRDIPASVMRAVWLRDLGRCAFMSKDGRRCNERGFVEFHHVVPYAAGGPATVSNVELRCRSHNAYESDLYYRSRALECVVREARGRYSAA